MSLMYMYISEKLLVIKKNQFLVWFIGLGPTAQTLIFDLGRGEGVRMAVTFIPQCNNLLLKS